MLNFNMNVCGRLCADIEKRQGKDGGVFFTGAIAVSLGKDKTEFVDIIANERLEKILSYFNKGSAIHVSGTPKVNVYQSKDGTSKAKIQISINEIAFVPQDRKNQESQLHDPMGLQSNNLSDIPF